MPDRSNASAIAVNVKNAYTNGKIYDLTNPPSPLPTPVRSGESPLCTEAFFSPISNCGDGCPVSVGSDGTISVHADTYIDFVFDDDPTSIAVRPIGIAFKYDGTAGAVSNQTGQTNMPVSEITFYELGVKYPTRGAVISLRDTHQAVSDPATGKRVKWGYFILCQNMANGAIIMIDPEVENELN
jgi:hypothetical protein